MHCWFAHDTEDAIRLSAAMQQELGSTFVLPKVCLYNICFHEHSCIVVWSSHTVIKFEGVLAVSQDGCRFVVHSNNEQWKMHVALNSAAMYWCQVIAYL